MSLLRNFDIYSFSLLNLIKLSKMVSIYFPFCAWETEAQNDWLVRDHLPWVLLLWSPCSLCLTSAVSSIRILTPALFTFSLFISPNFWFRNRISPGNIKAPPKHLCLYLFWSHAALSPVSLMVDTYVPVAVVSRSLTLQPALIIPYKPTAVPTCRVVLNPEESTAFPLGVTGTRILCALPVFGHLRSLTCSKGHHETLTHCNIQISLYPQEPW